MKTIDSDYPKILEKVLNGFCNKNAKILYKLIYRMLLETCGVNVDKLHRKINE